MLPLECQYLNKSALTTLAGPLTPPVKHFQLKRKPKSATLRAELLQKCECRLGSPPRGRLSLARSSASAVPELFSRHTQFGLLKKLADCCAELRSEKLVWKLEFSG